MSTGSTFITDHSEQRLLDLEKAVFCGVFFVCLFGWLVGWFGFLNGSMCFAS